MCVQEKKITINTAHRTDALCDFRHALGVWACAPVDMGMSLGAVAVNTGI